MPDQVTSPNPMQSIVDATAVTFKEAMADGKLTWAEVMGVTVTLLLSLAKFAQDNIGKGLKRKEVLNAVEMFWDNHICKYDLPGWFDNVVYSTLKPVYMDTADKVLTSLLPTIAP